MNLHPLHIVIGSGLLFLGGVIWRVKRTAQHLEVIPSLRIEQIDFKHLTLVAGTLLKNPTAGSLKVQYPFVKLSYEGQSLGSSMIQDQQILIPPFGQTEIKDMRIQIPLLGLSGLAVGVLTYIQGLSSILTLELEILTRVDAGLTSLPVGVKREITFQRRKAA